MTDAHLWADTYDRKLTDIFAVESDIAKTIAETLQAKLTGSEKSSIAKVPDNEPGSVRTLSQGPLFGTSAPPEDLRKAIDYFNRRDRKGPELCAGLCGGGSVLAHPASLRRRLSPECIPPAEAAINRALELDESSSEAHAARGMMLAGYQFDYPAGKKEYERALQLNQMMPRPITGLPVTSWERWARAEHGDRRDEARARSGSSLARHQYQPGKQLCFARIASMKPSPSCARRWLWTAGSGMRSPDARNCARAQGTDSGSDRRVSGSDRAGSFSYLPQPARACLRHDRPQGRGHKTPRPNQDIGKSRYVDPYYLAIVHLGLGDREAALTALEKSFRRTQREHPRIHPHGSISRSAAGAIRASKRWRRKIVPAREFAKAATLSK